MVELSKFCKEIAAVKAFEKQSEEDAEALWTKALSEAGIHPNNKSAVNDLFKLYEALISGKELIPNPYGSWYARKP